MRLFPDDLWACLTIRGEAENQSPVGKIAVGRVIRNRMEAKFYSDGTVLGTIFFNEAQFTCWQRSNPRWRVLMESDSNDPIVQACMTAWHTAMLGEVDPTLGALHYFNRKLAFPVWAKTLKFLVTIGDHDFYK